jgi:predicted extracellular nuclease
MTKRRLFNLVVVIALLLGAVSIALPVRVVQAVSPDIVISQVYGGGGNSGATYTHDFIELFNRGSAPVSLAGWSVQYASATGTGNFGANSGQLTELPGVSLAPGQYLLIQEASTAAVGLPLPTPDATDATPIAMSGTAGKVALINTNVSLGCNGSSTVCTPAQLAQIVDLIGYGNANFYEGSGAAPTLSNTTDAVRLANGCADTDNNATDFVVATPTPRNTTSPLNPCSAPPLPDLTITDVSLNEGNSGTTMFTFNVNLSSPAGAGSVTFDIATQDNSATTADNDYAAQSLTGQSIPAGSSAYTFSVVVNGDTAMESDEAFFVNVTNVTGATGVDDQGQGTILTDDIDYCVQPYTPTYHIQGSGLSAAITGTVTAQGVVVGDFEGTGSSQGFYLQDSTGDGDVTTSDGLFVFSGAANLVNAGDVVRVTGFARERFNQTTLNGSNSNTSAVPAANIINCGTGAVATIDVTMPFADANYLERFEGMLVRFPQSLVISEYFNYDQFGEIVLALPLDGESRPFTGTAIDEPGGPANARTLANSLRRITLDDAQSGSNPSILRHPNGSPFALNNRFRGGDLVQNALGVLGYDFNLYRIVPTGPADYAEANPRPAAPEPVGGTVHVAAMNTLNFFITQDYPTGHPLDNKCGPLQNVECRGADFDQSLEFTRQRDKLLAALFGLNADIIGLNELENTAGVDPLGDPANGVVAGLNALLGANTYAYIDTGIIGTDAIRVGLIYKPAGVTPVGDFKTLTSAVDPRFIDTKSRPTLAQTFEVNATGARFTVAVNHLKSKGSACTDVGDPDLGDGQGNCSQTRRLAGQALVDWLATDPTGSGDPDFIIIGDLNSYAQEDSIDAIKAGSDDTAGTSDDFINLIAQSQGPYAYSYTFDGQAGYLDHALANSSLAAQVTGAADWHINSDEPDVVDYDTTFKPASQEALYEPNSYRSSDHDPIMIGLIPNAPPTVNAGGSYSVDEGASVMLTASGSDPNGDTLTYEWDLDNDGSFETNGQTVTFDAASLDGPGSYTFRVKATDPGGLFSVDMATVTVNNVAPMVNAPTVAPEPSTKGSSVAANATFSDPGINDAPFACTVNYGDGSGDLPGVIAGNTCTGSAHTYTTIGLYVVTVSVTDKDGGFGSNTTTHRVIFNFAGFFHPIDNLPEVNRVFPGQIVLVRFSLDGNQGKDIFAQDYPKSQTIACDSTDLVNGDESTATIGHTGLYYLPYPDQYVYFWRTDWDWRGTCRQLVVELADGTYHRANFKFK